MITVQSSLRTSIPSGANVVLFVFEKNKEPDGSFLFEGPARQAIEEAGQDGFEGKKEQIAVIHVRTKELARIFLVGLGSEKEATLDDLRKGTAAAARKADQMGLSQLLIRPAGLGTEVLIAQAGAEGAALGLYQFTSFQSKPPHVSKLNTLVLLAKDAAEQKKFNEGIAKGLVFAESVNFVRDAVNTPPSDMDPEAMAQLARKSAGGPVQLKVFNKSQIQKLGMGGLLGVNRGSAKDPVFLHFSY